MKVLLLDTNIVSILFNLNHPLHAKCVSEIDEKQCYISFMTRGELLLWPKANRWGRERSERLERHIRQYTTLFPDDETCAFWAGVMAESRHVGRPMATSDGWIAATAKRWDLALLTADYRDFEHLSGLTLIPL